MSTNELKSGEPRLGWFVDGDPQTDRIAVMLRDTGSAIELTVPLRGMLAREDPYGRWCPKARTSVMIPTGTSSSTARLAFCSCRTRVGQ